jgi:hypothetical protein
LLEWLREKLTKRLVQAAPEERRIRVVEDAPSDRFVLLVALMVTFFAGLIALEVANMVVFRQWSETVFNGIMLIVGTIVGAVWGRSET